MFRFHLTTKWYPLSTNVLYFHIRLELVDAEFVSNTCSFVQFFGSMIIRCRNIKKKKKFVNLIRSGKNKFFLSAIFLNLGFPIYIYIFWLFSNSTVSLWKCVQNPRTVDNLLFLAIQKLLKWIKNIFIFFKKNKTKETFCLYCLVVTNFYNIKFSSVLV